MFLPEKKLQKHINKIKTNLLEPGEPKNADESTVFEVWQAFATPAQTADMRQKFADGIAWGQAKKELFELINSHIAPARERYEAILEDGQYLESVLKKGAEKARSQAAPMLAAVRKAVGLAAFK